MKSNFRNGILIVCVATLFAGCTTEPNNETSTNPAGIYTLVSVNGDAVPCAVKHGGRAVTVKSGQLSFGPDQTCASKTVFSLPKGEDVTREVKATFKQDGARLTMKWKGAGTTTGRVEGNTFTMNNEGMMLSYRK